MKKILALVTALSFAVPVIADGAFAAPPGQTKPGGGGGGKPGGGGGGGGHKPGRPGGGGGGGGRPPGGGGGGGGRPPGGGGGHHKPRPPGNGGGHKPRPPGNGGGHRPRPPGNGHKPRPPGNGYRPGRPGYGGGWTRPRPNQWYWRGSWVNRVHVTTYVYPRGYAYRHWGVGAILPALFLTSTYFYDDVGPLGLQVPPYGYRWVRYGPDLLLVNIRTGSVEEVASGVFY